ncbi:MAG TPA: transglutaminase-like domain-containing protein, partial [Chthonomonadales bacterium]|nr:transglutaminase-like domain-containing protein [Chthonomonadales bacterium]
LTVRRPPNRRLAGNCRDFATMLCAMLRHQGVPARVRYGFATYFEPDYFTDHVVCEYWNEGKKRWVVVDAQVDEAQHEAYQVTIDTCDVSSASFVVASKAWHMYRTGEADPALFGIFPGGPGGESFIRSGLARDLAALNKLELLCQDAWGLGDLEGGLSEDDLALLDRIANLSLSEHDLAELRVVYENDNRLRVPKVIKCYTQDGVKKVNVATGEYVEDVRPS